MMLRTILALVALGGWLGLPVFISRSKTGELPPENRAPVQTQLQRLPSSREIEGLGGIFSLWQQQQGNEHSELGSQ